MKVIFIVDNFNTRKIEYDKNNSIMFIKKQKNQNTFIIKNQDDILILKIHNTNMDIFNYIKYLFIIKRILNI